jgi:hypothetical protein
MKLSKFSNKKIKQIETVTNSINKFSVLSTKDNTHPGCVNMEAFRSGKFSSAPGIYMNCQGEDIFGQPATYKIHLWAQDDRCRGYHSWKQDRENQEVADKHQELIDKNPKDWSFTKEAKAYRYTMKITQVSIDWDGLYLLLEGLYKDCSSAPNWISNIENYKFGDDWVEEKIVTAYFKDADGDRDAWSNLSDPESDDFIDAFNLGYWVNPGGRYGRDESQYYLHIPGKELFNEDEPCKFVIPVKKEVILSREDWRPGPTNTGTADLSNVWDDSHIELMTSFIRKHRKTLAGYINDARGDLLHNAQIQRTALWENANMDELLTTYNDTFFKAMQDVLGRVSDDDKILDCDITEMASKNRYFNMMYATTDRDTAGMLFEGCEEDLSISELKEKYIENNFGRPLKIDMRLENDKVGIEVDIDRENKRNWSYSMNSTQEAIQNAGFRYGYRGLSTKNSRSYGCADLQCVKLPTIQRHIKSSIEESFRNQIMNISSERRKNGKAERHEILASYVTEKLNEKSSVTIEDQNTRGYGLPIMFEVQGNDLETKVRFEISYNTSHSSNRVWVEAKYDGLGAMVEADLPGHITYTVTNLDGCDNWIKLSSFSDLHPAIVWSRDKQELVKQVQAIEPPVSKDGTFKASGMEDTLIPVAIGVKNIGKGGVA